MQLVSSQDMAARLRCSEFTVGKRLALLRQNAGLSKRKPDRRTAAIRPQNAAALDSLTPKQRAAWDAAQEGLDSRMLTERLGCRPSTARQRLHCARRAIAKASAAAAGAEAS